MINRILNQMNNNRLSTSKGPGPGPLVDRDLLLRDFKVILEGGSNYVHFFFIKIRNRCLICIQNLAEGKICIISYC